MRIPPARVVGALPAVVLALVLVSACSPGSASSSRTGEPAPGTAAGSGGSAGVAGWDVAGPDPAFVADPPEEGTAALLAGDRLVVLGEQEVAAYDAATGESAWRTDLPAPVCAGPPGPLGDRVVVLLGADGACTRATALDTADGRVLWTSRVPRAARAFGHEVAIGSDTVVVSGECAGFSRISLADGTVTGSVAGEKTRGRCATAASDGSSVVLSSRGRLSAYDAATGARTGTWPAAGLGRVGDVVSADPLVVTARYADGASLVDLSGPRPRRFGRDAGWFGGEAVAAYRLGDVLWVQYDGVGSLVGYDLATRREVASVAVGDDALLGGVTPDGDRLVVTVDRGGSAGSQLWLVDPGAPDRPTVVGSLPRPARDDGVLAGTLVAGDRLVRVWQGRIEGIPLD